MKSTITKDFFILSFLSMIFSISAWAFPTVNIKDSSGNLNVKEVLITVEKEDGSDGKMIPVKTETSRQFVLKKPNPRSGETQSTEGYKITDLSIVRDVKGVSKDCSVSKVQNLILKDNTFLILDVKRDLSKNITSCEIAPVAEGAAQ